VVGLVTRKDLTNMNIHRKLDKNHHDNQQGGHDEEIGMSVHDNRLMTPNPLLASSRSDEDLVKSHGEAIEAAGLDQGVELTTM
jgi:hypothetical protein